jgi:imidazolonepropionase
MLRVIRKLATLLPVDIQSTCLAAHALPPEYKDRAEDYIDFICDTLLPIVAREKLADAVDAFCEHLAFSPAQVERIFDAAQALGLPVKLHAEQLSALHGSSLAANYHALSADHLNTPPRKMLTPWRPAALSPSCCPAHGIYCVKNSTRP